MIQTALRHITQRLAPLGRSAVDFLYPPSCLLCSAELTAGAADCDFCPACFGDVTVRGPACRQCGATIGPNLDPTNCPLCRDEAFRFERVIRLGVYKERLRGACLRMKHPGQERLAASLAECLWRFEEADFRSCNIDLVVPVPRHWRQRFARGHSAPAILAEIWGRRLVAPVAAHVLRKTRWTIAQATLVPTQRRTNLRGAFAVPRRCDLHGARVLLVDDVMTTGATANECTRALRSAGAETVVVAVLARGLGKEPLPPADGRVGV